MAPTDPRRKTVDRLRADIDRGLTGEDVPTIDPAAAPFGTDTEAGGARPTRPDMDLETRRRTTPETPAPERRRGWLWAVGVLAVLLVVVVIVVGVG